MKKNTYKGWLNNCEYGFLTLDEDKTEMYGESLAEMVDSDWKSGDVVSVRYYICENEVTEEDAKKALINKLYGGELECEYELDAYSEYTILEWAEGLRVGGHDLIDELSDHLGKYALIIIEAAKPV